MPEQPPINPYQSPLTTEAHPEAAQWLGTPSASLARVALGLGIVYAGIIVMVLGVIAGVAAIFATQAQDPATVALIALGVIAVACIGGVLNIVGSCLCLATPEETGAREMIQMSVGAMLAALLLGIVEGAGVLPPKLHFIQSLVQIVAAVTFLRYLGLLGQFIGRRDLACRARSILIWGGALIAISFAAGVIVALQPGLVAAGAIVVAVGGWLLLFFGYVNLISATRKAILNGSRAD